MRAIWSGEVAFGLVTVPVKLYSATRDLTPHFHLVHKVCGSRVQLVRRCPKCDRDVPWDEIDKGYEVGNAKYVRFSREELGKLEADESRGLVEIVEFIDPLEVDLAFIEKSYWVGPAGKNARSFLLLRTVLEKTRHVAVAKVAIRTRTRLALLRPRAGFFALDMMRFADELVDAKELTAPIGKAPTDKELALAKTLVDQLTLPFDPEKHPDEYRARVDAAVDERVASRKVVTDAAGAAGGKVVDLSDLLARSLQARARAHARPRKSAGHARKPRANATRARSAAAPARRASGRRR